MGFQHGVCRYADWSKNVKTGNSYIKARLNGANTKLVNKWIDDICEFHLDVEIVYHLNRKSLKYAIMNNSEDKKGTFGIHWYFKNPINTKVLLLTKKYQAIGGKRRIPLDSKIFCKAGNYLKVDMNRDVDSIFENRNLGPKITKGIIQYENRGKINFLYDDIFKYTTIFNINNSLCFEPVSSLPNAIGRFDYGRIRIRPTML